VGDEERTNSVGRKGFAFVEDLVTLLGRLVEGGEEGVKVAGQAAHAGDFRFLRTCKEGEK
jgi:hypothetical protein